MEDTLDGYTSCTSNQYLAMAGVTQDLSFLEFKESDDDWLRAQKAFFQMAYTLPEDERRAYFEEAWVKEEESRLQWMIDSNKRDDELVEWLTSRARYYVELYGDSGDDKHLEAAEDYADMARLTKESRYSIGDIRKQRERIQWQRRRLNQAKLSTEPKQS